MIAFEDEGAPLPAVTDKRSVLRLGPRHRADATQKAWVARLTGRDPDVAARAYVRKARRRELWQRCFSQRVLDPWRRALAMPTP